MSNEKNIFEVATRERFRFQFKGLISVEDLWMLQLKDLDTIFKALNSELKQTREESLLEVKTQQDEELETRIKIVKHIFEVKLSEDQAKSKAKENKEKQQKIMELIAEKKNSEFKEKSVEELEQMLKELNS